MRDPFRNLSIKRKLTLIITLTSGLAVMLACAGFVLQEMVSFRSVTLESTRTIAKFVGQNAAPAIGADDAVAAREVLDSLDGQPHIIAAVLYNSAGRAFARYVRPGAEPDLPGIAPSAEFEPKFYPDRLELAQPVHGPNDRTVGMLYLVSDLKALDERIRRYFTIAAGLLLLSMIAASILSAAFQRIITAPLSELVNLARRVSTQKNYSLRATPRGHDEIGVAIEGFNDMLEQIQRRDGALRGAHDDLEERVNERTHQLREQIGERVAAEKALQQQFARISLLNQITTAISNRQDLESIVQIVLAEIEAHLPADFASLSLHDSVAGTLQVAAERQLGKVTPPGGQTLAPQGPLAVALTGLESCRAGQQVYVPRTAGAAPALAQRLAAAGLGSMVAVPLMLEHRLFGVLVVARGNPDAFASGESEFLRVLGEQVALAGAQARLYTELQRAYTELRQSQQTMMQQERLRALGQMASGIAHDINNTLSPIVAYTEILQARETGISDAGRRHLSSILTAGEDIGKIVVRLREFSRPRASHEKHTSVQLGPLLVQVSELTRPRWRDMAQGRGAEIRLQLDLAEKLPPVAGNETELRECFINLVLNAVDAMPKGGTLTLRTRLATAGIIVEIGDTGVGMDEETRKRCFEPFFSTKGQLGTGLGLAMVYGGIERHQARIEVDSTPGAGTTMRVIFPSHIAAATEDRPSTDHDRLPPLHILCIDDEASLRQIMQDLLRLDDHKTSVAATGGGKGWPCCGRQTPRAGRLTWSSPIWACRKWTVARWLWPSNANRPPPWSCCSRAGAASSRKTTACRPEWTVCSANRRAARS